MADPKIVTGVERFFEDDEIIVSKTDTKGHLTYANTVFLRIADMTEEETLGQPHNVIRHPDMPRCIFKLLWDTVVEGREIFAYVINRAKNGDHYWVLAHVTPTFDAQNNITGYHSNRRVPNRKILEETIIPLYKTLLNEEAKHSDRKVGMAASLAIITNMLEEKNITYDELIASLI